MKTTRAWAIQSFILCFFFNLALGALVIYMADRGLQGLNQWISALGGAGAPPSPDDLNTALGGLRAFVGDARGWLAPVVAALTVAITFLQWFFLFLAGGRQIRRAAEGTAVRSQSGEQSAGAPAAPT